MAIECAHCGEAMGPSIYDSVFPQMVSNVPLHTECQIRAVIGSVAHIERRCSCYVLGSDEEDDPLLSKRDAARAAAEAFLVHLNGIPEVRRAVEAAECTHKRLKEDGYCRTCMARIVGVMKTLGEPYQ